MELAIKEFLKNNFYNTLPERWCTHLTVLLLNSLLPVKRTLILSMQMSREGKLL